MKLAFVHEWLTTYSGSERVLEQMLGVYPQADLYSIADFLSERDREFLRGRKVTTTFIQRLPFARRGYRYYLPVMPLAVEGLDVSGYDVVVSSSHSMSKGVITGPDQLHVCMCYSPIRYAWDLTHQYLRESGLDGGPRSWLARSMLHRVRLWDVRTAFGVDQFIAISRFVARRIRKVYRRESTVIYPPVDVAGLTPGGEREDFYLTASRFVPYKRLDLIVAAFAEMPKKRLMVIGEGPGERRAKSMAGPNVTFLGYQPRDALVSFMQRARAFVFAAQEDFGIVVAEAQACGTPVVAYGRGGATEIVNGACLENGETLPGDPTGVFFAEQSTKSLQRAVQSFEEHEKEFSSAICRTNAERFSVERFRQEFRCLVEERWRTFERA